MDKSYHALMARTTVQGETVWLLKPQTFMNLSGKSVSALARFFKVKPEEVLVVHDELDLAPGEAKLKFGGGHAGHNGLRDIHAQLATGDYWRLRLGIGHPGDKLEVANWVLKKPSLDHRIALEQSIDRSLKALPALLAGDMTKATMLIHTSKPPRPKPPVPPKPELGAPELPQTESTRRAPMRWRSKPMMHAVRHKNRKLTHPPSAQRQREKSLRKNALQKMP
jgi:PTH1 family peptidyl-tRNA hydrolase